MKRLRFVPICIGRVLLAETSNKPSGRFSPRGLRQLSSLSDDTADWALSRLNHTKRNGGGSLDFLLTIRWKESGNRPNANCEEPPGHLDVMAAAWNQMKSNAQGREEGEKQTDQPNGFMARIDRHEGRLGELSRTPPRPEAQPARSSFARFIVSETQCQ